MTKLNKILFVLSLIVLIVVSFSVLKSGDKKELPTIKTQAQDKFISRESDGGNVKITVTPKALAVGEKPSFNIVFETHSVDLTFDVTKISSLIDEKGRVYNKPVWEGTGPGGHHRNGTLAFNTFLPKTEFVKLIIRNVSGVPERAFSWELF